MEVCIKGIWKSGQAVEVVSRVASRVRLRVEMDGGAEVLAHIGRVVLRGPQDRDHVFEPSRSRSRSRSRGHSRRGHSPDWSRSKGKSDTDLVEELRERAREEAVCSNRKDYAKRPPRFDAGLALKREHGTAEGRLIEEETYIAPERPQNRRRQQEDEEQLALQKRRRTEEEDARQKKLKDIFEKYGQQKSTHGAARSNDVDGPDTMRLGLVLRLGGA